MNAPDDDLMRRTRALFDAQVDALDGATATALRARRRDALASAPSRRHTAWWWPASGIATAALAVVLWLPRSEGPMPDGAWAPMSGIDTEAAAGPDAPDAMPPPAPEDASRVEAARFADSALVELDDDAEFYTWLASVPDDAGLPEDNPGLPHTGPNEGLTL